MTKKVMLEAMHASRAALLKTIDGLPEADLREPGVVGNWSIKDVLVHISLWEGELVRMLFTIKQGQEPNGPLVGRKSEDEVNAEWFELHKDRPLERVMADFHAVRKQTERNLQAYNDEELNSSGLFPFLKGRPLEVFIRTNTFEHEQEHCSQIEAWKKGR